MAPPTGCTAGQVLKFDGTNWVCGIASTSGGISLGDTFPLSTTCSAVCGGGASVSCNTNTGTCGYAVSGIASGSATPVSLTLSPGTFHVNAQGILSFAYSGSCSWNHVYSCPSGCFPMVGVTLQATTTCKRDFLGGSSWSACSCTTTRPSCPSIECCGIMGCGGG